MFHIKASMPSGERHSFSCAAYAEVPQPNGGLAIQIVPVRTADGSGLPDRMLGLGWTEGSYPEIVVRQGGAVVDAWQAKRPEEAPQEQPADEGVVTTKPERPAPPAKDD